MGKNGSMREPVVSGHNSPSEELGHFE